jgi:hypothetical protein
MQGYAIEAKLIRWTCKCKTHVNGACTDRTKHKREVLREAYVGNFGYDVRHMSEAFRKWDRKINTMGD